MTVSLLKALLRFFDTNLIGRILNRYGEDTSAVDFIIPFVSGSFLAMFFFTVCQLATSVYLMNFLGALIIPLVWIYVRSGSHYLAPSREVTRLWKLATSPILNYVSQSEQGVVVIRAFGQETVDVMVTENFVRNDMNSKTWFADMVLKYWFQLRMQLVGFGVVTAVVSSLVYLHSFLSPGLIGLAFSYALSVDGSLASLVMSWSFLEIQMVSPERILEYGSILAEGSERPLVLEPDASWPRSSTIQFQDVVFRVVGPHSRDFHSTSAITRKSASLDVQEQANAASLCHFSVSTSSFPAAFSSMTPISPPCHYVRCARICLLSRSRLCCLRETCGPTWNRSTSLRIPISGALWRRLTQVSALDGQLSYELSENGENFSVGERQMLCMARALLTRSRIVVMDEATASIDHTTEEKLQRMINTDFQNATVLTIAHRLVTVLDSDRIMVLSDGQVVEFDSPRNLVKNSNGVFYALAKEGGCLAKLQE